MSRNFQEMTWKRVAGGMWTTTALVPTTQL